MARRDAENDDRAEARSVADLLRAAGREDYSRVRRRRHPDDSTGPIPPVPDVPTPLIDRDPAPAGRPRRAAPDSAQETPFMLGGVALPPPRHRRAAPEDDDLGQQGPRRAAPDDLAAEPRLNGTPSLNGTSNRHAAAEPTHTAADADVRRLAQLEHDKQVAELDRAHRQAESDQQLARKFAEEQAELRRAEEARKQAEREEADRRERQRVEAELREARHAETIRREAERAQELQRQAEREEAIRREHQRAEVERAQRERRALAEAQAQRERENAARVEREAAEQAEVRRAEQAARVERDRQERLDQQRREQARLEQVRLERERLDQERLQARPEQERSARGAADDRSDAAPKLTGGPATDDSQHSTGWFSLSEYGSMPLNAEQPAVETSASSADTVSLDAVPDLDAQPLPANVVKAVVESAITAPIEPVPAEPAGSGLVSLPSPREAEPDSEPPRRTDPLSTSAAARNAQEQAAADRAWLAPMRAENAVPARHDPVDVPAEVPPSREPVRLLRAVPDPGAPHADSTGWPHRGSGSTDLRPAPASDPAPGPDSPAPPPPSLAESEPEPVQESAQHPPSEPPVVEEDGKEETSPKRHGKLVQSALMIGELILAVGLGVGLSYVFRLLWDIAPYIAAVSAPIAVCALVANVGWVRKRMGLGAMPLGLLLVILFVATLLVVLPAAWILSG